MSHGPLRDAAHQLGRAALAHADPAPTDGELVARFVADRDEAAFAELVRRHGPAVLGVCRRIVGHAHDAEDAFQAVFVVLARKAGSIRPPGAVGGWLYGVAVRTAHKARAMAAKRHRRLAAFAAQTRAAVHDPRGDGADVRAVVDEELAALSDEHRAALVLCDLHGKSRSEAARELGWPAGTVATRLAKARQVVAARLRRRGVAPSAVGLGSLLAADAPAVVPPALAASAVAAALGPASAVPPAVHTLALGVTKAMSHTTGKLLALAAALAGLFGAGVVVATGDPAPEGQGPRAPAPRPAAGRAPATKWTERVIPEADLGDVFSVAVSPDGRAFATGAADGTASLRDLADLSLTWAAPPGPGQRGPAAVAFSPDGTTVAATTFDGVRLHDRRTGKQTGTLAEPAGSPHAVAYFPDQEVRDGVTARRVVFSNGMETYVKTWLEWPQVSTIRFGPPPGPTGGGFGRLAAPLAVSPDGKRAIITRHETRDGKFVLMAWGAGSGAANHLLTAHTDTVFAAAWSADGRRIATGGADGKVVVWDAETFEPVRTIEVREGSGPRAVGSLAFAPDGRTVAAGLQRDNDVGVVLLDAESGARRTALTGYAGETVSSLAFTPDGKSLVTAGYSLYAPGARGGRVRVWSQTPAK